MIIHDTRNAANIERLKLIVEAAENSNYQGQIEANIAVNGRPMLALLKLLKVEVQGLVKYGHLHVSLLHRIENAISLAEQGTEHHGTSLSPSHEGHRQVGGGRG